MADHARPSERPQRLVSADSSKSFGVSKSTTVDDKDGGLPVVGAGEPDIHGMGFPRTPSMTSSERQAIDDIVVRAQEEYTPEQYRRVLRKQDLILLPLMWLCVSPACAEPYVR